MIIENTIEIERPIEEVFEVTTCTRRCVVWVSPVFNSQMDSDEPVHFGSTFHYRMHFFGKIMDLNCIISELDPPYLWAFKSLGGVGFSGRYTFTPTEHGTTFHAALEIKEGLMMESLEDPSLLKSSIKSQLKKSLPRLKDMLENNVDLWALIPA